MTYSKAAPLNGNTIKKETGMLFPERFLNASVGVFVTLCCTLAMVLSSPVVVCAQGAGVVKLSLFEVERTQQLRIPTQGRARVLILQPELLEIHSVSEFELVLRGLRTGSSIVHLWDRSGRRTIRVDITELFSMLEELRRRRALAQRKKLGLPDRSLKIRYRGSHRNLERGPTFSLDGMQEQSRIRTHQLNAEMGLASGQLVGNMYLEQRRDQDLGKEVTQPRHLSLELKGVSMGPLGKVDLLAGDKDLFLSPFTLDGNRFRGFGLFPSAEQEELYRQWRFSLFGGEEREGFGLDLPAGLQTRADRSRFGGVRLEYGLWEKGSLYLTGLKRFGDVETSRSDHVYEIGLDGSWMQERLQLSAQAARDGTESAHQINAQFRPIEGVSTHHEFWRVGKNYETVTGGVTRDGQTGWKNQVEWIPPLWDKALSLSSDMTLYRDRNAVNPNNPREWNSSYGVSSSLQLPWSLSLRNSARYRDESGSTLPFVSQSYETHLSKEIPLENPWILHSVSPFLGYRYTTYDKSNNVPGFDANLGLVRAGARARFGGGLWTGLTLSKGSLKEGDPESGPALSHPREFIFEVGEAFSFEKVPLDVSLLFRYVDVKETFSKTHQPFSNRNRISGESRLRWRLADGQELFASFSAKEQRSETGEEDPVADISLQIGVRLNWDTNWAPMQSGRVSGVLFKDLNGNGEKDPDEPGIARARIEMVDGRSTTTGSDGSYLLRSIPEGPAVIRILRDQIPEDHFFTTPNSAERLILPGQELKINFGFSARVEFQGTVYNDLNGNLIFEGESDLPVGGIRLFLDSGQSARSGSNGSYLIRKATPGSRTLSVDISSVPVGYQTRVPIRKSFETAEGDLVRFDLPLRAQRNLAGSVFMDGDYDGFRHSRELGVANVRLWLNDRETVSDENGIYRFSRVPPGSQSIRLDPETLPIGYQVAEGGFTIEIQIPKGPISRDRLDFPLVPEGTSAKKRPELPKRPLWLKAISPEAFQQRFPTTPLPEEITHIELAPARVVKTVRLYTPESIRRHLAQMVSVELLRLPMGLEVEVLPLPAKPSSLRTPGLVVKDFMLKLPYPEPPLPTVEWSLAQILERRTPSLPTLILQALRGKEAAPQAVRKLMVLKDQRGEIFYTFLLAE